MRAALANLEAGSIVQGASTITQQVIKYAGSIKQAQDANQPPGSAAPSVELDPGIGPASADPCEQPDLTFLEGRGFEDKIREVILARQVTAAYPGRAGKERILETYLNLIYYGNRSYGIKAAAANFFGTSDLDQLTLSQAAFLSGLPQRPSYYDPYQPVENPRGPARAIARRNDVLAAMLHEGYITQRQHDEAVAVTWEEMNPHKVQSVLREPHFAFRVQHEVERILAAMGVANPAQAVRTGGYRIITTLDYPLQQVAKEQVSLRGSTTTPRSRTRTSTTGRWWRSTRRPARSSPTSAASTTTTATTPACRASSTLPGSADGSRGPPSSRSPTARPSSRARRPPPPSSWTPWCSTGRRTRRTPTSRPTPISRTRGRCWPSTRCATRSTSRR